MSPLKITETALASGTAADSSPLEPAASIKFAKRMESAYLSLAGT
ncbi:hypothetical protein SAMN02745673_04268 [Marinactinospora thermotolerans DSM 45154]|uniref:Uncharacterized protein n=1 Tax=Marinactinospora thermotolerans DSM 45154 TaxID=1122192 RepID=A0A1T4T292_9ACTN|nr:hypothetical protein SAMN02745673_04268 [Marinactinospora thermotolerans DSM 45154]